MRSLVPPTSRPVGAPSALDAPLLASVAAGGAVGATCRHLATMATPQGDPWIILAVNVIGCFLMGALVASLESGRSGRSAHRLLRPFLGTGVLGGFTTVSTYAVTSAALLGQAPFVGLVYLLITPVLAVAAAGAGVVVVRGARGDR